MRHGGLILLAACGLMLAGCGKFKSIEAEGCRITDVEVSAERNVLEEQINVYEFRFLDGSECEGAKVAASYNVTTQIAQDKIRRSKARASSTFQCPTDPWQTSGTVCIRIDLEYVNVNPTPRELAVYEHVAVPLSAFPLTQIDRDTLRGQLGNALKHLPPPGQKSADTVSRIGPGSPRHADVVAPQPAPPQPQTPNTGAAVRLGAQGRHVQAIQFLLREHNFDVVVDGDFGSQTEGAVRAFQRAKGLTVDGIVGPRTWSALWVTVRQGAPNEDAIQAVQTLLNWHGVQVVVDGDFGDQTLGAVRSFQQRKQLTVDGIVGFNTWSALVRAP